MIEGLRKILLRLRYWRARRRFKRITAAGQYFADDDLVYAATYCCDCGAGLAYPFGCGPRHYWDCSDILTGRSTPGDSKRHSDIRPFEFWEIRSENQPSARGYTTRPKP